MLYKKVMLELKSRIDSNEFTIGDTLPTEKELMAHYSVSRITIRKAIEELVKLGMVEKRQGAGSTIIGKTMVGSMLSLKSTSEYLIDTGAKIEYKICEFTLMDADDELAEILEITPGEKVYFIRRFKLINGAPSVYEDSYMPMSMYPKMNVMSMEGSKYHYLENELGFEIDGAFQDFNAILPDKHMCEILGVSQRKPLIQLLSVGKLVDGRIFEYTKIVSKPETITYKHYLKR
ncbi:GntR family transcriptional regulator [Vibrio scophthalmi]|uniref:Exu regulon transcriptional regulator n=1 Tax=Vibrio scophthalmi TaxID=45658 RepID=A0A1E3WM16_9VIBR|nr:MULTISPECIES: GntR family transcriptional regulator [Vibrio]EGU36271.1 GntR family transcriptional regulator [Vibrio sp. N418]MCY9803056.1 GntR family transcriptional regulator [Vibrio scophthalmi]ODS10820.1 Exu regulon transcriptional regulator [Vibrio scophthalmi]